MSDQEDIRSATTPRGERYFDADRFSAQAEAIFAPAWHLLPPMPEGANTAPFSLLPGMLDEPLLQTREENGRLNCLSNVCTHRGMRLCSAPGQGKKIRCPYHGRRFALSGEFEDAPGFEGAQGFPRAEDDLASLSIRHFGPLRFFSLEGALAFDAWIEPLQKRLSFLPLDAFVLDTQGIQVFEIEAQWELYVENYLEGFHVPWVHKGLAAEIDGTDYRVEALKEGSVQIAFSKNGPAFEIPAEHPEAGLGVAAWYFHLFPNLMVNVYPWGISVNVVEPLSVHRTRIRFLPYVWRSELREKGAGASLRRVELEDEFVVEGVHAGLKSRLYRGGRYAPGHEQAVFAFHRRMDRALNG